MTRRVVVAGVGNVFLRDDGFGVEVVQRLRQGPARFAPGAGVEVVDVGIRGIHLAYDLLDGCDLLVLVDAAPLGGEPGSVQVLEIDPEAPPALPAPALDAHGLTPDAVLAMVRALGGRLGRVVAVACQPATVSEGLGLSEPVAAAVEPAALAVAQLVTEHLAARTGTAAGP